MIAILTVLIIITALLLMLIVLIQNPKGSGLSATFGGGGTLLGGVKRTSDILEKGTWTLAIALFVLVITVNVLRPTSDGGEALPESAVNEQIDGAASVPAAQPVAPLGTQPQGLPESAPAE